MIDPKLQARLIDSCTEAAFGYTTACVEAWSLAYVAMLDALSPLDKEISAGPPPAQHPATPFNPASFFTPPSSSKSNTSAATFPCAFNWPFAAMPGFPTPATFLELQSQLTPADYTEAWMSMWLKPGIWTTWRSPMIVWPATMALMAAGMPRSVALPTAKANAAVMDAAEAAQEAMSKVFSAYRSDGGHASTHLRENTTKFSAITPSKAAMDLFWSPLTFASVNPIKRF